jgi:hypothetical protein
VEREMRIFHPAHRTAWSVRTTGFPLLAVRSNGELVDLGGTRRQACRLQVPEDTVAVLWHYKSNGGYRTTYILEPRDGLPERLHVSDWLDPQQVAQALRDLPEQAVQDVLYWLFPG